MPALLNNCRSRKKPQLKLVQDKYFRLRKCILPVQQVRSWKTTLRLHQYMESDPQFGFLQSFSDKKKEAFEDL